MSIAFSIAPVAQVYSILCYICYFLSVLVYSFFHFFLNCETWEQNWSSTSLLHRIDITRGFITSMLYLGEVRCVCLTLSYIYLYFLSLLMFKEIQLSGLWAHVLYASWKFSNCFLFDSPVMLRKFDSGVMVIQNKSHSDEEVISFVPIIIHTVQNIIWAPFIIRLLVSRSSLHN